MKRFFCTMFDENHLLRGLALIASIKRHGGSDAQVFVLCADEISHMALGKLGDPQVILLRLTEVDDTSLRTEAEAAGRSFAEYLKSIPALLLAKILKLNPHIDLLTYVDANVFFCSSPEPLYNELGNDTLLVVSAPNATESTTPLYSGAFLCIKNTSAGAEILTFWQKRSRELLHERSSPSAVPLQGNLPLTDCADRFKGIIVSKHPGLVMAPATLTKHALHAGASGHPQIEGRDLILCHLSGLKLLQPELMYFEDGTQWWSEELLRLCLVPYGRTLVEQYAGLTKLNISYQFRSQDITSFSPAQLFVAAPAVSQLMRPLALPQREIALGDGWVAFAPVDPLASQKKPAATPDRPQPTNGKHSILFINTCYDAFLAHLYREQPDLVQRSYAEQLQFVQSQAFGDSDFYSRGMQQSGWDAVDIIVNCATLQGAWLREHPRQAPASATWEWLMLEQVKEYRPQVVYCQDMHMMRAEVLQELHRLVPLVAGQIASSLGNYPYTLYDVIFSSFEQYATLFRSLGISATYQPLAFEERLLDVLPRPSYDARPIECSFVGSISAVVHGERAKLIERLASTTPIEIWGTGINTYEPNAIVHQRYRGEAWGKQMFDVMSKSKITINNHAVHNSQGVPIGGLSATSSDNLTRPYANNMRLFEATGCGALLITDFKDNLNKLFTIGKEVVAYRTAEECEALVQYYLGHPAEAQAIAQAGQQRTLRQHTYSMRMQDTAKFLESEILALRRR